ncbi:MAG TPA: kelch repeat-containing protein [Cyclobacteriaceae bacterium]|jgi:N-acetylneuraminic acid mutarotase|nr:kelch repeat-containing protein [Cyclobacteriaceae bacterium]
MERKRIWPVFIIKLLALSVLISSCNDNKNTPTTDLIGDWLRKSDFEGVSRSGAVTFTIGTRVFVGTGFDGTYRLKDLWEFDAAKNTWFRKADFPGVARNSAVAFSANGKGYIGTGYDGVNRLNDFWEYNPTTNAWAQIADFPADSKYRYGAVSMSTSTKGYVGAGYGANIPTGGGNDLKDWWSYNPTTATWTQEQSIGGSKRSFAFSMVIDGKGYVGGGSNNGLHPLDFWEFDPSTASWTQKNNLDDVSGDPNFTWALQREAAATFTINGLGYLTLGNNGSALGDCWQYDPSQDIYQVNYKGWTQKTNFEGTPRDGAVGFSVGSKGYITTGRSSNTRFDDIGEFDPTLPKVDGY